MQDIIAPLGVDETAEWCNNFVLAPKANGKVRVCLDPARLNLALIRPMHRGPTLNDILPKLNIAQYLSLIDASSGYHKLKLDGKSSYLERFACHFGRYRYKRLLFRTEGDMFQRKIDEIFKDFPHVFSFVDDILVVGYEEDGNDHDERLEKITRNVQTNKSKT